MRQKSTDAAKQVYVSRNLSGQLCLFTKRGLAFQVVPPELHLREQLEQFAKELGYELMYQIGTPLKENL